MNASRLGGYSSGMGTTEPTVGELEHESDAKPTMPDELAAHELAFGRESTSGYVLEQEARHTSVADACAEQVTAAKSPDSLEQHKPNRSIRV